MRLAVPLEPPRPDDWNALCDAARELHAHGITAVHDFEGAEAQRLLRRLAAGEGPRLRVLMHFPQAALETAIDIGLAGGLGDQWFRLGAVKLFADGTLGSRSAAMLAPYDDTGTAGCELLAPLELRQVVRRAVMNGWPVAVHAIGDRAVRNALDAFAAVTPERARLPLACRIEHAQLVAAEDLPRFAQLGIAASMQPQHCVSDIPLAARAWGSRRAWSYPWRALLDSGAWLAFGSDAPVEPPVAALGLHAALARRAPGATTSWVPEQAIGLDAALTAYTEMPARLAGWQDSGTLEVGACADLVVWNVDLHGLALDELAAARPLTTIVGGEVVHAASDTLAAHAGGAA